MELTFPEDVVAVPLCGIPGQSSDAGSVGMQADLAR